MKKLFIILNLLLPAIGFSQGTAFTYQGRLNIGANVVTGGYDFRFKLYADPLGNTQVGGSVLTTNTPVTNGLFTVAIDFGSQFPGSARWLEVDVRTNDPTFTLAYNVLSPLQSITPAPYAIFAGSASNVIGTVSSANLSGTYGNAITLNNSANQISGTFAGNGTSVTNVNASALNGLAAASFWQMGGNNVSAGQFLGSTNGQALEFKAGNARALRLEPNANGAPNVIGGSVLNYVANTAVGATIGGGGATNFQGFQYWNSVLAPFGTVGGGSLNQAGGTNSTVAGGSFNSAVGQFSFVGGGSINGATNYSVVAGGIGNSATGPYSGIIAGAGNVAAEFYSVVGGGYRNTAGGIYSFVGGGQSNTASINYSTAVGGNANTASGSYSTVGGGLQNKASGDYSAVAGGDGSWAAGGHATVAGGYAGSALSDYASVGGGYINSASGLYSTVPGGQLNVASSSYATVGGGFSNAAKSPNSTVAGGSQNLATNTYSTVGGGSQNIAGSTAATVSGGSQNVASNLFTTVGGGTQNKAFGNNSTVGGGQANIASLDAAVVGGGYQNVASGAYATVGGGTQNTASGYYSTVPGGFTNIAAGDNSFAAGQKAQALHPGTFVWSDSQAAAFASTASDQFLIRAQGNVGINTNNPAATLDVNGTLRVGAGTTIFKNLQGGIAQMASGSSTVKTNFTFNFPKAFSTVPTVVISANSGNSVPVDDTFAVSVRAVSTTSCTVNVVRVDNPSGWSQQVKINWIAWE
jgi:hypothetical protein